MSSIWPSVGALKLSFPVVASAAEPLEMVNLVYGKFPLALSSTVELAVLSAWNVSRYASEHRVSLPTVEEFRSLVTEEIAKRNREVEVEMGGHQGVGMVRLALTSAEQTEEMIRQALEETLLNMALLLGVERLFLDVYESKRSYRVAENQLHPII